jgi:hypothetical protein
MIAGSGSLGTLALVATGALWGSNHVVARSVHEMVPLPALVFWRWLPAVSLLSLVAWPSLMQAWPEIRLRLGALICGGVVGVGLFSFSLLGGAYQSLALEVGFINAPSRSGSCCSACASTAMSHRECGTDLRSHSQERFSSCASLNAYRILTPQPWYARI